MTIRFSALGALCAALVVTAGLVASAGSANADTTCVPSVAGVTPVVTCPTVTTTPVPTTVPATTPVPVPPWHHGGGGDIVCTTATSCTQNGLPYTGSVAACTSFPCRLDANGAIDNDPAHHHYPGGGLNGNWLNGIGLGGLTVLNGNTIVLGNQQVDVCAVPTWNTFYNRYNPYLGSWRAQLNELRYQQLVAQACGNSGGQVVVGNVVVGNGLTLVNGQWIDLSQYGVVGGQQVSVCQYNTWQDFNGFGARRFGPHFVPFDNRFGGYLAGNWGQLRVRAHCAPQVVVVPGSNTTTVEQAPATVTQAAPAPAATPEAAAPEAAPAPLTGSGHYRYPTSAPDTGN